MYTISCAVLKRKLRKKPELRAKIIYTFLSLPLGFVSPISQLGDRLRFSVEGLLKSDVFIQTFVPSCLVGSSPSLASGISRMSRTVNDLRVGISMSVRLVTANDREEMMAHLKNARSCSLAFQR